MKKQNKEMLKEHINAISMAMIIIGLVEWVYLILINQVYAWWGFGVVFMIGEVGWFITK